MPPGGRALQGTETSSRSSPRLALGQRGGAGTGARSANLTSLWGAEGRLAGGPQAPAVKSLQLQVIGAVGPQAIQDGAGGVGGHHHVAFVDVPLAVPPLTALPPVRQLQVDRRSHSDPRVQWYPLPSTGTLSSQPRDFQKSSWQVADARLQFSLTLGGLTPGIAQPPTPQTLTLYPRRWPLTWAGSTGHHLTSTALALRILMSSSLGFAWGSGSSQ